MLNPECVDYEKTEKDTVNIGFTDGECDGVLSIRLNFKEAYSLGRMLIDKTNMKAKKKYNEKIWENIRE